MSNLSVCNIVLINPGNSESVSAANYKAGDCLSLSVKVDVVNRKVFMTSAILICLGPSHAFSQGVCFWVTPPAAGEPNRLEVRAVPSQRSVIIGAPYNVRKVNRLQRGEINGVRSPVVVGGWRYVNRMLSTTGNLNYRGWVSRSRLNERDPTNCTYRGYR
jgi:hypothetical protein